MDTILAYGVACLGRHTRMCAAGPGAYMMAEPRAVRMRVLRVRPAGPDSRRYLINRPTLFCVLLRCVGPLT